MIVLENFDKLLDKAKEQYNFEKNRADRLSKELQEFNEEERIRKKNEELTDLRRRSLHILSDKERQALDAFQHEHYERHKDSHPRTSGSSFTYKITGVGIGTIIEVTCPICGESQDITDTSSW